MVPDVEVVEVGQDHFVKVTGLAENTEVTVTVRMTKDGLPQVWQRSRAVLWLEDGSGVD